MRTRRVQWRGLFLAALVFGIGACSKPVLPPPTAPFPPREEVAIESYKFRVAVVDFTDQTDLAGDLIKTIPDILTTTLFKAGRLDLYERNQLRGLSSQESGPLIEDLMNRRVIDGVITGAVTQISGTDKNVVIELRLLSRNKAVMYADHHTLKFRGRRSMEIAREDVAALADSISRAIPSVPNTSIVSKSGNRITLGAGENKGLISGLIGYVQTPLDQVSDPSTGEIPRPTYVIVGEVVIDQVAKGTATGRIVAGEDVRAKDIVQFK